MTDLDSREQKVMALNVMVHRLPEPNIELLSALSRLLIEVVDKSDINKMTIRNGKSCTLCKL